MIIVIILVNFIYVINQDWVHLKFKVRLHVRNSLQKTHLKMTVKVYNYVYNCLGVDPIKPFKCKFTDSLNKS
jgi:hypothetical protein